MLSTLVLFSAAPGQPAPAIGALVRTLGALVPATVEGLVRDLTIVATKRNDDVRRVADHAGCALVEDGTFAGGLRIAARQAKSPRLFLLRAGAHVDRGFLDEVGRALNAVGPGADAPVLLLRQAPAGLKDRLLPGLSPVAGVIANDGALDLGAPSLAALVRRLGPTRTLAARATMA